MILPLFKSQFSLGRSILTLEERGASAESGPDSIFDICGEEDLDYLCLVDDSMTGYLQAYKNAKENKMKLMFGLRIRVCPDLNEKNEDSLSKTHKIIIFVKNKKGYTKLIKISTEASLKGFYYKPRIDYEFLKNIWNDKDLCLCIPFYDSYIYKNLLTSGTCVPEFDFTDPIFFLEDNNLPFDNILRNKVNKSAEADGNNTMESQSIFYKNRKDFKAYLTFRCINNRSSLDKPEINHMCSNDFCLESWKEKFSK